MMRLSPPVLLLLSAAVCRTHLCLAADLPTIGTDTLIVTGMWTISDSKRNRSEYEAWSVHTSTIHAETVAFGDSDGCKSIETQRKVHNLPISCHLTLDPTTFPVVAELLTATMEPTATATKQMQVRKVILSHELGLIWSSKVDFVAEAMQNTPTAATGGFDWFAWVRICVATESGSSFLL